MFDLKKVTFSFFTRPFLITRFANLIEIRHVLVLKLWQISKEFERVTGKDVLIWHGTTHKEEHIGWVSREYEFITLQNS